MKKKHILHLTPHIGGGVGRVLLNYLNSTKNDSGYSHEICCLDTVHKKEKNIVQQYEIKLTDNVYKNISGLFGEIKRADIILLHWWNHPLLFSLLVLYDLPPCRLIIWSHVSGLSGTNVFTEKLLNYADKFLFTTPISYKSEVVRKAPLTIRNKLNDIWSTSGVEYVNRVAPKHCKLSFCIGYLGTVDYAKLHPDFVAICNSIEIDQKSFIVCGGSAEKDIAFDANNSGFGEKFTFTGEVSEVNDYFHLFDVFGYPLSSEHYGTCDQVLAEAMAAGVVPVVFNNPMECSMVEHLKTGLIVTNKEEYARAIELLYNNEALRLSLSQNAVKFACEFFSLNQMIKSWNITFDQIISLDKSSKNWLYKPSGITGPVDVFFESLGGGAEPFKNFLNLSEKNIESEDLKIIKKLAGSPQWQSKTKGTVHHYLSFFPDDKQLLELSSLLKFYKY